MKALPTKPVHSITRRELIAAGLTSAFSLRAAQEDRELRGKALIAITLESRDEP